MLYSAVLWEQARSCLNCRVSHTPRVWDLESGSCTKTLEGHTNWVRSVAISPDGKTVVSGSDDRTVR